MHFTIEQIARVCHEANRGLCEAIGDMSQKPWEEAPDWQKDSAIGGVKFHLDAAASGITPSASMGHDAWLADKIKDGWKFGPVKNAETKEHPCIVPYDVLPFEQRMKDYLFSDIVDSFLNGEDIETAIKEAPVGN
jgi:hypothetical protein